MKCIAIAATFLFSSAAFAKGEYREFVKKGSERKQQTQQEGVTYMVAGGIGLATSLGLSIRTDDMMPKIGYAVMQGFSSIIFLHGAALYTNGDERVEKTEALRRLDKVLRGRANLTAEERMEILDAEAIYTEQATKKSAEKFRYVRGALQLTAATTAGTTLFLSKPPTSLGLILGMLTLGLTVGGTIDLLNISSEIENKESSQVQLDFNIHPQQIAFGFKVKI